MINPGRSVLQVLVLSSLLASAGCGSGPPSPGPDDVTAPVPELRGVEVMVLPAHNVTGLSEDPDPEIEFALRGESQEVRWIFPDEIRAALRRSPGMDVDPDALAVGAFLQVEVRRVGDPLFGELRRLGALTGAQVALMPVRARYRRSTVEAPGAAEILGALVHVRTGRVMWTGVVEGSPGEADDPRTLATAAEALARALLR